MSRVTDIGPPSRETIKQGYEERDVSARFIGWFAAIFTLLMLVTIWVLSVMTPRLSNDVVNREEPAVPPEPRLQVDPRVDLDALRARENAILGGYQWVDREQGTVAIPVDLAMEIVVRDGLPVREEARP